MLDKLSAITALIAERAMCRECLATKTDMDARAVDSAIAALSGTVKIDRYLNGTCLDCRKSALVFAIDRPPNPREPLGPSARWRA
jgi:hypothetical protein